MNDVQRSLGRIEGKLETLIEVLPKHEQRIRGVERKQSWFMGAFAVCGAVISFVFHRMFGSA